MLQRRARRSFHPLRRRCACGSNIRARGAHDGESRPDAGAPRELSDERISQLRRFLAGRRGQAVAVPETEVPHAVPVGNTGMILAIAEGSSGGFGARMWPSAKTIVNQIALQAWPHDLRGKNVLELGCGVGMAGLAAGAVGAQVLLTDRDAAVLERAEANLHLNATLVPAHASSPAYLSTARVTVLSQADVTMRRFNERVEKPRLHLSSGERRKPCSAF
jgi:hypothetical protein